MAFREISLKTRLWLQTFLDHLQNWRPSIGLISEKRRWLELTALEDRVFLSASPAGAIVPESAELLVPPQPPEGNASNETGDVDPVLAALEVETTNLPDDLSEQLDSPSRELVLIDAGVRDADFLLNDLRLSLDPGRTIEVIQLDGHRNGVEQISEILGNHQNLNAVHFVSHGRDGAVKLGNHWLDRGELEAHSDAVSQWRLAFAEGGDLLFYGCDLAATDTGQGFVNVLAELTGTDVAASEDATGALLLGGDWNLEYHTGSVESGVAFSQSAQQDFNQLLATLSVDTTNDILDGDTSSVSALLSNKGSDGLISLREAIIASNNTPGADDIFLSSGTYTLAIGSGDDSAAQGDLDILDDLTITGADAATTIIDAAGIDRVFHIRNNSTMVSMSGLTIRGGSISDHGAGVFVDNSSTLNLTDVILTDNNSNGGNGGAIHVHGTLNLNRVLLSNNSAGKGGGIYFHSAGGGSLTNVTISGNRAGPQGGGIWTDTFLSITNSTITENDANVGGGVYENGGTIGLMNTIIAGNTANGTSPDVFGTFNSAGNNLIQDTKGATGFVGSDLLGVDPLLNPLSHYGGSIPTHSLQSSSRAINAGASTGAPTVDGRNIVRNAIPDIGAFERSGQLATKAEFRVNTTTTDTQVTSAANRGNHQAVAMSASGDYVVVWSSLNQDGDGWGLYGRRFNHQGTAIGTEFLINETTAGNQQFASVAMNDFGEFVVSWSEDQTGNIFAQRYTATGTPLFSNTLINTTSAGSQSNPSVSMNNAGDVVVVWEGNGPGDSSGIFGQRLQFDAGTIGTEFRINTTTFGTQANASVSMNQSGQFVVSWDDGSNFYAQRFHADGSTNGGEILIQSTLLATNGRGAIAIGEDGSFVATWTEDVLLLGKDVYVRRYAPSGSALGTSQLVNTTTLGTQTSPSISMDLAGNFLVVWEGNGTGDSGGVFGQKFDSNGDEVGSAFLINQTTSGAQEFASVALYDLDNFVVVWSGEGVGDSDGVFARQFGTAAPNAAPIINSATFSVSEAAANGTTVGTITASDPDMGDTLTFSFTGGPAGAFALNSQTGELTVADGSLLDFESTPMITLMVSVLDNNLLSDTATVAINLNDVNEQPTVNPAVFSINENSAPGTLVGKITASDPDAGDSFTLAIVGGNPGGFFVLDGMTGNLQLTNSASLDFETASQHFLQIQVMDAGGLQSMRTIGVQVNDVNETPILNDASFNLADNAANGTLVGALNGLDVDAGDTLTYEILAGNDEGVFSLNAATGQLRVADSIGLDFANMPQFLLTVRVTDAVGLIDTATVTINVAAANVKPEVTNAILTIDENAPVGTNVGTVSATDPNSDTPLTYSIILGNPGGVFEIDANTGEIRVANTELLNYEFQSQFTLVVRATNASGVSGAGVIRILVNDLNEPPVAVRDFFLSPSTEFFFDGEDLTRNDINPEGENLLVIGFANLGEANIINDGNQTFRYVLPDDSPPGLSTFTYFVRDESGRVSSARVLVALQSAPNIVNPLVNPQLNPIVPGTNSQLQNPLQPRPQVEGPTRPNRFPRLERIPIQTNLNDDISPQELLPGGGVFLAPVFGQTNPSRDFRVVASKEILEPLPQSTPRNQPEFLEISSAPERSGSPGFETYRNDAENIQANKINSFIANIPPPGSHVAESTETMEIILQEIGEGSLVWKDLNQMEDVLEAEGDFRVTVVGTAVTVTSTLTIGYVLWMIRGGVLLGSLLTQMPAWRFLDPLPVLEHLADREDEAQDQESLESIIEMAGRT